MTACSTLRAIGLIIVGLCGPVGEAPADVDRRLVGLWELQRPETPFNKDLTTVFEFRADGTYTLHDAASGHAGTYAAADGRWSLEAATTRWQDGGTYAFPSEDVLALTGLFGPSEWRRWIKPSYFATATVGGQPIPLYVPAVLARTWLEVAKPWRADAVPVMSLKVERWDKNGQFMLTMRFLSPSTGAGLVVDLFKFQRTTFEHQGVNWPDRAMPLQFVDLPEVIEVYTREGKPGPYKSFAFEDMKPGWGWVALPDRPSDSSLNLFYVTEDGRVSRAFNWEYIDWYNEAWDRALAPFQRAFTVPADDAPYRGDAYWQTKCEQEWRDVGGGHFDYGSFRCFH